MLGLICSLCTVVWGVRGPEGHFPISNDQQLRMFETWKSICLSESAKCSRFASYPVNLDELEHGVISSKTRVLAIDIGGSFLKTDIVDVSPTVQGSHVFDIISGEKYPYKSVETDCTEIGNMQWNEWVASRVREFIDKHCPSDYPKMASLTFSYPIDQRSVSSGRVRFVAKNWRFVRDKSLCQDDVVESLNNSLWKRHLDMEVKSVSNDVISTYMCGCAHGHNNSIAVVMGTGTNAGFVLRRDTHDGFENPSVGQKACRRVLVNSEWASCPVPEGICTDADKAVMKTKDQLYSGRLMFELLVAGVGFVDIVKNTVEAQDQAFSPDNSEEAVLRQINRVFYADGRPEDGPDAYLYDVVRDFKTRSYKMIAPLIVASMVAAGSTHITVITNGSCLQSKRDREMLRSEIEAFLSIKSLANYTCTVMHYNEASLFGSVYLTAVSSAPLRNSS